MVEANFTDILDAAPTEVEYPETLPVGSYNTVLVGIPAYDKSSQKQTPYYEFTHKLAEAMQDVNEEALTQFLTLPDGTKRNLSDVTVKQRLYVTENSKWRLDEFFENCGFELDGGVTRRQMAEQSQGQSVGIVIKHVPTQDGKRMRSEIARTFKVE